MLKFFQFVKQMRSETWQVIIWEDKILQSLENSAKNGPVKHHMGNMWGAG